MRKGMTRQSELVARIAGAIRDRADMLDSGVFAPPEVQMLSPHELDEAWAVVARAHFELHAHEPDPSTPIACRFDGQRFPCRVVRDLARAFDVPLST